MIMFQPNYQISNTLLKNLKQIAILVHELNKQTPNPNLNLKLMQDAIAQSTYASTTIEGNPLALTKVKALLKQNPKNLNQSEQEIINYNEALNKLKKQTFNEQTTLKIHKTIMQNLIIKEKQGSYRQEPVFIHNPTTGKIIFLPPDHQDLNKLMTDLYTFIKTNQNLDPVILAGLFHKQFVLIHPFIDGNGRTVRLASTLLLQELGINLFNLLSFENYYNQNITKYFKHVGEQGNYYDLTPNFTPWLEYFAEGILFELQRLEDKLEQENKKTLRLKNHHKKLLEYLKQNGSISDKDYAKLVDRAKATRALDFKFLIETNLIQRKGKGPSTYYTLKEN